MTSLLPRLGSPNTPVDAKVWDMIFLDTKTKRKNKKTEAAAKPNVPITAKDIDIRNWSFGDRKVLVSKSDRLKIFTGDTLATTISKPLLRATSATSGEILKDGMVKLPADTDKNGVCCLVNYLESIIRTNSKPLPFTRSLTMAASLSVCAAASLLGMKKYTLNLYKKCETLLRIDPPEYEDINAIILFKKVHKRLFNIVVKGLAVRVWENTVPDPEDFALYLTQNPVLDTAIKSAIEKREYHLRRVAELKERCVRRENAQTRHEAWMKEKTEREAKRRAGEEAFYAAKAAKEAALEKSIQLKIRAREPRARKFTAEEAAHYRHRYNKKPPNGC